MGGSLGKNESSSGNASQFNQNIPKFQSNALTKLYAQANNQYGAQQKAVGRVMPGANKVVGAVSASAVPAYQKQLQGGAFANVDARQLQNSLNRSLGNISNTQQVNNMIMGGKGNNYADAMKSQYLQDANMASKNMLSNLDARAAASGMSGGARHGIAQGLGFEGINKELQRNLAETGFNTFDKDLDRKLSIAGQADQSTLQRQQLMSDMLGQKQQAMSGGLQQGANVQNLGMGNFAPTMMPWQNMQNYAATVGAPTILSSGTSKGSSEGKGKATGGGVGGGK